MDYKKLCVNDFEHMKDFMSKSAKRYRFSGDVSLYFGTESFYHETYGFLDDSNNPSFKEHDKILFNPSSHFMLCIIIMMLSKKNVIHLENKLDHYIPEYKDASKIRIIDLLYQRARVIDIITHHIMNEIAKDPTYISLSEEDKMRCYAQEVSKKRSFSEVLSIINQHNLIGEVDKDIEFSISHSLLLEEVIVRVTEKPYLSSVDEMVFKPLQIDYLEDISTHVKHYIEVSSKPTEVYLDHNPKRYIQMSTDHIKKMCLAIINHKLIDKKMWNMMTHMKDGVGMGLFDHSGMIEIRMSALGHHTTFYYHKTSKLLIITLSNFKGLNILETDRWYSFSSDVMDYTSKLIVYPKKPKLEKFNINNQTLLYDIELDETQYRYVPSIFRVLSYTYLIKEAKHYVLIDHGLGVGMVTLIINPKENLYEIRFLMVDKKYQGRGYGKILLQKAMEILKKQGAKTLEISVFSSNKQAYHTYLSAGFVAYATSSDFIALKKTLLGLDNGIIIQL